MVILEDLRAAIGKARLTRRQQQAVHYVFIEGYGQVDAGKALGIAQKNVSEAIERALTNIAEIYEYWAWHGEGYAIHGAQTTEEETT